jgi:formylglycine-generating enzyme required for sulfatase activity
VTLTAFFLSKYELTQGQWLRLTGRNPSYYRLGDYLESWNRAGRAANLLHPVEQVNWTTCTETCSRLGLILPSEAQWEYGARGGTETPWWTGSDPKELASAGNVADGWARAHDAQADWFCEAWDDGNTVHAAVGSYRANAFGLHDVLGNVWEWSEDKYSSSLRNSRGGSFINKAVFARSADRGNYPPVNAANFLGLRPARIIAGPFTTSRPSVPGDK